MDKNGNEIKLTYIPLEAYKKNKNGIERIATQCTSKEKLIGTVMNSLSRPAGPGNGHYSQGH